jgi:hypothetical protein
MRELRAAKTPATAELRAFAAEWPGALKELDTLPTEEIARRVQLCVEGGGEPWMAWSLRYHELMRAAFAVRRGEAGVAVAAVDEAFARLVKRPPHGRINVVVFAALAREFDVTAREIWDALFPPRGRARRDYR